MVIGVTGGGWRLDLYWIPLGAGVGLGSKVVRASGGVYERMIGLVQHRAPVALYHSALIAVTSGGRCTIESAPVLDGHGVRERGVVGGAAVGSRLLGGLRVFRYEVRCWLDGTIPDVGYAVASPVRISDDPVAIARVLEVVRQVPTPVWGRDELRAGEMWNSNSVISWCLEMAGLLGRAGPPPEPGRAPGWDAGVAVARRSVGISAA